jgi:D-alanyl-D-alanine carboxypeptidase
MYKVSTGVYEFAAEKYKSNVRINFGRDIVVKEGVGGPHSENFDEDRVSYLRNYSVEWGAKVPSVGAKYFLVADLETKQIIFSRDEDKSVPHASITKLMTALIADEEIGLEKETVVSSRAVNTTGEQGSLFRGEKYSIENLLYPLLLESSNDAAEVLAEFDNRDSFIMDMNAKAKTLGMTKTSYSDPSGLSSKNVSSANDLLTLANHIHKYRSFILDITKEKSHRLGRKVWFSNSKFKNDKNWLGGKNGYISAAGKTNIALFSIKFQSDLEESERIVAVILLNTQDIERDTRAILSFLQKNVRYE